MVNTVPRRPLMDTFIDQLVNQTTVIDVANSGDNANITAVLIGSQTALNA